MTITVPEMYNQNPITIANDNDLIVLHDDAGNVTGAIKVGDIRAAISGLPIGGGAGEFLTKIDGTDYNVQWTPDNVVGGGTIQTGGFTLTVPATGTAAILDRSQTFTGQNIFKPGTVGQSTIIDTVVGQTSPSLEIRSNGSWRMQLDEVNDGPVLRLRGSTAGGSGTGGMVQLERNTSGAGACGTVDFVTRSGESAFMWVEYANNNVRIHTAPPLGTGGDSDGVVVGSQTSALAAKNIVSEPISPAEALKNVVAAAKNGIKRFEYRNGAYEGDELEGIILDESIPETLRYGIDGGKSLNEITTISDAFQAIRALSDMVTELKDELSQLRGE